MLKGKPADLSGGEICICRKIGAGHRLQEGGKIISRLDESGYMRGVAITVGRGVRW